MKAWVANDKNGLPKPRLYIMFFGDKKPRLDKSGYFVQGRDSDCRWPVPARHFGPIEPGKCIAVTVSTPLEDYPRPDSDGAL